MTVGWGGDVIRISFEELVQDGLPAARTPGEVVRASLREAHRELALAELASRQSVLLQDCELATHLAEIGQLSTVLVRTRLRLACDVAERGLHLGSGFTLADWLQRRSPELAPAVVRDLARLAGASREPVHRELVDAVHSGAMALARAAAMHRALGRIRSAIPPEDYERAVTLLVGAGCDPVFDDAYIARIIDALLRACLPEKKHEERRKAQQGLRDVHESNLADGSVRRIVMTFGDDADYEAVHAILTSPLAAPASKDEQGATGVEETRTPGQRRYDALMTVLRRGVAGTRGQPTTPKATLVVTMDLQTLRRELAEAEGGRPGCGATLTGAPVSASTIRQLACEADIIPMVLGGPSEIVDQGRGRRLVTLGQRIRLAARDKGCTIPGCTVPATWCEAHHVVPWAHGGRSDLSNYALLCPRHHTWVHEHGFGATVTALGVIWIFQR
ncbi:HNH endonuclease signature motif containing protein [Ornithinimicrobium cerasi]|uniref:HNH endonuclease n=1 Tax=Ornithinimicrobium cerasi TaxID=2248773 RepID=A0A285VHP6_9MICO|nr:HNH endonuclease signature motif containing protein [Ornithinimicrobium cerasi]SOC53602.1 HNH endonuclease [Ornithinimicrobium cerasi]